MRSAAVSLGPPPTSWAAASPRAALFPVRGGRARCGGGAGLRRTNGIRRRRLAGGGQLPGTQRIAAGC
eukprot:scaffold4120_cov400-Prasinococcus_capsulatus_cf.AAC.30